LSECIGKDMHIFLCPKAFCFVIAGCHNYRRKNTTVTLCPPASLSFHLSHQEQFLRLSPPVRL
jgi:hypothetical protein